MLQNQVGPLKVWQWIAIVGGAVIAYYLYEKYKANSQTAAASTGDQSANLLPTNGTTGMTYAGFPTDTSTTTDPFTDPNSGQSYWSELLASEQSILTAIGALSQSGGPGSTPPVASTTPPVPTPTNDTTTNNTTTTNNYYPTVAPSSGSGGSGGATGGGGSGAGGTSSPSVPTFSASYVHQLPVAQQIALAKGGQIKSSLLGPTALKIYNAGGISTQYPTAKSLQGALPPTAYM